MIDNFIQAAICVQIVLVSWSLLGLRRDIRELLLTLATILKMLNTMGRKDQ